MVSLGQWPDDLSGPQEIGLLHARGVAEVRHADSGELIDSGQVDVGKHLRPNFRGGKVVLFVTPAPDAASAATAWRAMRLL